MVFSNQLRDFLNAHSDKKIVFTNGCFDILHKGHVWYLNEARGCGDLLIVGLNSDASVKRLKGHSRPINCAKDRKYIIENLKAVDFVEVFEDDTPIELIKFVKPKIYVKGGDYTLEQLPERSVVEKLGGSVKLLSFVEGHSTSSLIEICQQKTE